MAWITLESSSSRSSSIKCVVRSELGGLWDITSCCEYRCDAPTGCDRECSRSCAPFSGVMERPIVEGRELPASLEEGRGE